VIISLDRPFICLFSRNTTEPQIYTDRENAKRQEGPLDKEYRIVRRIERGEIDIKTAAEKAGYQKKTIRRWLKRYREDGRRNLIDKRSG